MIAVSRTAATLEELRRETGQELQTITVDLSDWTATRNALKDVEPLDGLVNNAGIAIIKPVEELTEEDFDRLV